MGLPTTKLAKLALLIGKDEIFGRPTDDPMVKSESRYHIRESGLVVSIERTWRVWRRSQQLGRLNVQYLGVQPVAEVGGRPCHILVRTCDPPEEDGVVTVWLAYDAESWLQVGSRLTAGERLIGSYYFRDVRLNPAFPPDQFTRANLLK